MSALCFATRLKSSAHRRINTVNHRNNRLRARCQQMQQLFKPLECLTCSLRQL